MLVVDLVELVAGYGFEQVRDFRFRIMERVEVRDLLHLVPYERLRAVAALIDATITAGPGVVYAAQSLFGVLRKKNL